MSKIEAFLCDVDGTVAFHTEQQRAHFDYSKVAYDTPNKPIIDVVDRLAENIMPIFMSGRADENNGQVRLDTEQWLFNHTRCFTFDVTLLFMRPEFLVNSMKRDFRKDFEVKRELYYKHVEPFYDILFAIDDRPQVLRMWHELGIPTLAVGTPWIEF